LQFTLLQSRDSVASRTKSTRNVYFYTKPKVETRRDYQILMAESVDNKLNR